ncbi:alpha-keto acid decarboxylase family protein [Dermatophilus congolensis]|nr:thiamine pyrophosphate-binding protein [Dermatophilus congolensis]
MKRRVSPSTGSLPPTSKEGSMNPTYTIGDYLLDRLVELGITDLFGVPGDYNLRFLDHVLAHNHIRWVGSGNELNAGYAADGYARIRGAGALLTTYGVGELSAANALAGSYAESVPVIHIVGAPRKEIQAAHQKLHHSLGTGDFQHFLRMANEISCATANLEAPSATWEIDHVLRTAIFEKKPGFLLLAADVAATPTEPPTAPLKLITQASTTAAENAFDKAARAFLTDKKTAVLADIAVQRLGATEALNNLLAATGLPVATLSWGKTLVDESAPNFAGIYVGSASEEPVRSTIEDAQALITIGVDFTDNTTAGFSGNIDTSRQLEIRRSISRIGQELFTPLSMERAIGILTNVLTDIQPQGMPLERPSESITAEPTDDPLTQDTLWTLVANSLTEGNIVLADQGTSFFGMSGMRLPQGVTFIGQPMWGSIGYTLPAMLGAGLANRNRRPVLLIGDGAAQLTIQELGQIIREHVPAVIVLVNNNGYTVERMIHGKTAAYNDIPAWRWTHALQFFGADPKHSMTITARTGIQMQQALEKAAANPNSLVLIEAITDTQDAPQLLHKIAAAL